MAEKTVTRGAVPLFEIRPLAGVSVDQQAATLRAVGAHPPAEASRCGSAAMVFRDDATVLDLFETAQEAHSEALGVLLLLERDIDASEQAIGAASAARAVVQQAAGCLAILRKGLAAAMEVRS